MLEKLPPPVQRPDGDLVPAEGTPWIVIEVNSSTGHAVFSAIRHPAVKLVVTHELAGRVLLNAALQSSIGKAVRDLSTSLHRIPKWIPDSPWSFFAAAATGYRACQL